MGHAFLPARLRAAVQAGASVPVLALAGLLVGCMSARPVRLDEWGGAQNCHFAHVKKANFETALRRVFEASGPKVYGLRPEGGGALVEQHWTLDVIFASASGTERWRLEYAPAEDGIDVHAAIEHAPGTALSGDGKAAPAQTDAANYRLLWSRVDYVLGGRAKWPECNTELRRPGLCSNSATPPLRLARAR